MFWTSILYVSCLKKLDLCHDQISCWVKHLLLSRNFPFDANVRQKSHPLLIPLHCLRAKSNNVMRGQFECDVIWFCFSFDFVCSHVWCCCSTVCWIGGRGRLKTERPNSRRWKNFGPRWTGRMGFLKFKQFSWMSYVYHPF